MPKNPSKKRQEREPAAKEKSRGDTLDNQLKMVLNYPGESPTSKLVVASQLWSDKTAADFFEKIKSFIDSIDSAKGAKEDDADDELFQKTRLRLR